MNLVRKFNQCKGREHDIAYVLILRPFAKLKCIQELSPSTHNKIPNLKEKLNTYTFLRSNSAEVHVIQQ